MCKRCAVFCASNRQVNLFRISRQPSRRWDVKQKDFVREPSGNSRTISFEKLSGRCSEELTGHFNWRQRFVFFRATENLGAIGHDPYRSAFVGAILGVGAEAQYD